MMATIIGMPLRAAARARELRIQHPEWVQPNGEQGLNRIDTVVV
jgi:hypothetical protein